MIRLSSLWHSYIWRTTVSSAERSFSCVHLYLPDIKESQIDCLLLYILSPCVVFFSYLILIESASFLMFQSSLVFWIWWVFIDATSLWWCGGNAWDHHQTSGCDQWHWGGSPFSPCIHLIPSLANSFYSVMISCPVWQDSVKGSFGSKSTVFEDLFCILRYGD